MDSFILKQTEIVVIKFIWFHDLVLIVDDHHRGNDYDKRLPNHCFLENVEAVQAICTNDDYEFNKVDYHDDHSVNLNDRV